MFFLLSGFLDLWQGNKEAQQTMSATCLLSWTQISPPPPSSALSLKWWSDETLNVQMAVAVLQSSLIVGVLFARGWMESFLSVLCWVFVFLLCFFLSALLVCFDLIEVVSVWRLWCGSKLELEDVWCGAMHVTNMEAIGGRRFIDRITCAWRT